jgi:phage terminase large subunit-like protein
VTFAAFCRLIGEPIEAHQRKIAAAMRGPEREVGVCVGRGNDKTSTAALLGLTYLLANPGASVTIGAASRDQGRILFERMKGYALHPAISSHLVVRHLELRGPDGGLLRVTPSDGPRAHGLSSGLYILDELWAHDPKGGLLEACQTGLIKRADAKLLMISTAPASVESPWGQVRARALAQANVKRSGVFTEARGSIRWLEWSAPADAPIDDFKLAAKVNPAKRFTPAVMREAHGRVSEVAYRQFHLNQAGVTESSWLPAGAWQAATGNPEFVAGERIWIGCDIGGAGTEGSTAVTWISERGHVGCAFFEGDRGVLEARDQIAELAETFIVVEVCFDPWRASQIALELEERGITCSAFAQSDARMQPASAGLYRAIVERKLVLPPDPMLASHSAHAVARTSRRGWRIDRPSRSAGVNVDGLISLAMAYDRHESRAAETAVLGFI